MDEFSPDVLCEEDSPLKARKLLLECELLITGVRDFDLMEERVRSGNFVVYQSERWFKPESLLSFGRSESAGKGLWVCGFLKMIFPFAIRRAIKIMRLFKSENFLYLPIGIHAARDMARLCGLMNGDLRCLFCAPELRCEKRPFGKIELRGKGDGSRYCLDKMRMWGYFVAPGQGVCGRVHSGAANKTRILWVGRMLGWKRVDTIIKAVGGLEEFELDIVGAGPEEAALRKMAAQYANIHFKGMVPIDEIRRLMQQHDVYVLSSNEFEGWGAVVNEAMEEGMDVVGTYEAGASVTILPVSNLFHEGDWLGLRTILSKPIAPSERSQWTAYNAARCLRFPLVGGKK